MRNLLHALRLGRLLQIGNKLSNRLYPFKSVSYVFCCFVGIYCGKGLTGRCSVVPSLCITVSGELEKKNHGKILANVSSPQLSSLTICV